MTYLEQVQRGVDFIEENLHGDIALCDVARAAGMSQWHFQRIFRALTNETLKTYIRSRRLAHAQEALLKTDARILDIALTAGFQSQESFARAFKKHLGLPPSEYRKLGANSLFLRKAQFDLAYLEHINHNLSPSPEIRELGERHFVGLETPFYSVDSEKNNIATTLPALWSAFLPRLSEISQGIAGTAYGVIQQHEDGDGLLRYCAALEVTAIPEVPCGMRKVRIPAATYAFFTHHGPTETLDNTVNYIYSTWLAQSNYQHTYAPDLEVYGASFQQDAADSEMFYAIPIAQR